MNLSPDRPDRSFGLALIVRTIVSVEPDSSAGLHDSNVHSDARSRRPGRMRRPEMFDLLDRESRVDAAVALPQHETRTAERFL
jgi:hypothetical protein